MTDVTHKLDRHDLKLLATIGQVKAMFMRRDAQETRAADMVRIGLLTREMATYSFSARSGTSELRPRYTITKAGRAELASRQ